MKLLFDENLSHKLVGILAHEFPDSAHVRDIGLRAAEDRQIWDHACTHALVSARANLQHVKIVLRYRRHAGA